jgi:hypothetical protein
MSLFLLTLALTIAVGVACYYVGREVGREQGRMDAYRRLAELNRRLNERGIR